MNQNHGTNKLIQIAEYNDVSKYLKDFLKAKKETNPGFSIEVFARQLELKNKSLLAMCLTGARLPNEDLTTRLADYFSFSEEEKEYFERLIIAKKLSRDSRNEIVLSDVSKNIVPKKRVILDELKFKIICSPLHFAILEAINLKGMNPTAENIADKLRIPVTHEEITKALEELTEAGFVSVDEGTFSRIQPDLSSVDDIPSSNLRSLHKQILSLGINSLEEVSVEERSFSTISMAVNKSDIPRMKKFIRKFEDEFEREFESTEGDAVYSLNVNIFPLTR